MYSKVYIEDIGTKLIHGENYTCSYCNEVFPARFQYCSTEYWWVNVLTGKLTGVSMYKTKEAL